MERADLYMAHCRGADFSDTILKNADLRGANLGDADLSGADLKDANLSGAYLLSTRQGKTDPSMIRSQ